VVLVDVDEGRNQLYVEVESAGHREAVERAAAAIGIPDEAIAIDTGSPFVSYATLRNKVRPVVGGVQIGELGLPCTLGFNVSVTEKGSVRDHMPSFITAEHCTFQRQACLEQPNSGTDNDLGIEIDASETFPCPLGDRCRWSDASRIRYVLPGQCSNPRPPFLLAGIARPAEITESANTVKLTTGGTIRIEGERAFPVKGRQLHKVGQETGWTVGTVLYTCAALVHSNTGILNLCQGVVRGLAMAGDSGAPVFETDGPPHRRAILNGILWGGDMGDRFAFSPIGNIESHLGKLTTHTDHPAGTEARADLVPERRPGGKGAEGFCQRSDDGDSLIVRVRNQANISVALSTTTRVVFSPGGLVSQATPPIAGGASADVSFSIPSGCFNSDCEFTIAVDADLQIDESHGVEVDTHETNNLELGVCIG
jgi:hypothetical protein